ncbi:AAA family ATPase [Microbacterium sp.]|uniref:AAA family ATPase n=1 Tax=Microbacterium sp. TaxID=51671 RepID=UPI003A9357CA
MIIWLNGPFGAGKSTTTRQLVDEGSFTMFDAEEVGYMLQRAISPELAGDDFQELPAWRHLVVESLSEVSKAVDTDIVVPQTVLVREYWDEIADGLTARGLDCRAFTLHVDSEEHARRIDEDALEADGAEWRHRRRPDYDAALSWLTDATTVIDTTGVAPSTVTSLVLASSRT